LGETEPGVHRAVEPLPESMLDWRNAHHVRQLDGFDLRRINNFQLAVLFPGLEGAEESIAAHHLQLESGNALQAHDLDPLDGESAGRVGAERKNRRLYALDLAGDPIAIGKHDDVGLRVVKR